MPQPPAKARSSAPSRSCAAARLFPGLLLASGVVLTVLVSGCAPRVVLRPPTLPHVYEKTDHLGPLELLPVEDERPYHPILNREAVRRSASPEARDFRTEDIDRDTGGYTIRWHREAEVLAEPLVETIERALLAEAVSARRFSLLAHDRAPARISGEPPPAPRAAARPARPGRDLPPLQVRFRLTSFHCETVVRPDEGGAGALLPVGAAFIPVPGLNIGAAMVSMEVSRTAEIRIELAGTLTVGRGDDVLFERPFTWRSTDSGPDAGRWRLLRIMLEEMLSRATHRLIADVVGHVDGTGPAAPQAGDDPAEPSP